MRSTGTAVPDSQLPDGIVKQFNDVFDVVVKQVTDIFDCIGKQLPVAE